MNNQPGMKQQMRSMIYMIGEYICWYFAKSREFVKSILGQQHYAKVRTFFEKHAFGCIFGSMVVTACVFQYRYRKRIEKQSINDSDNSKSKKSGPQKLPEKLRIKKKFADDEYHGTLSTQNNITQNNESTQETRQYRPKSKTVSKKKKFYDKDDEQMQALLQEQVDKANSKKIILEDSKSDKIFNQMYGMYQEALR